MRILPSHMNISSKPFLLPNLSFFIFATPLFSVNFCVIGQPEKLENQAIETLRLYYNIYVSVCTLYTYTFVI